MNRCLRSIFTANFLPRGLALDLACTFRAHDNSSAGQQSESDPQKAKSQGKDTGAGGDATESLQKATQNPVGGRIGQPSGCESVPTSVFHQLQLEERVVSQVAAHLDRQLGSSQQQSVGRDLRRGCGANHEARVPARFSHRTVLWQRGSSRADALLEHAAANCLSVSQDDQGDGAGAAPEKIERTAAVRSEEGLNEFLLGPYGEV